MTDQTLHANVAICEANVAYEGWKWSYQCTCRRIEYWLDQLSPSNALVYVFVNRIPGPVKNTAYMPLSV